MLIAEHDDGTETREATISSIRWEKAGRAWKLLAMSNGETWKGQVGDVLPGTLLRARGKEVTNEYGTAFEVQEVKKSVVDTASGLAAWLAYRLPQVGAERAERLVDLFGDDLLNTIENNPQQLTRVSGITPERAQQISKIYLNYKLEQQLVTRLVDAGLKMGLAMKAYKEYGEHLQDVLKADPYTLMYVEGITFANLDPVCLNLGINEKDHRRVRAYAVFLLLKELNEGHCYLPRLELLGHISKWGFSYQEAADILASSDRLVLRENEILLSEIDLAEVIVTRRVIYMLERPNLVLKREPEIPDWYDPEQKAAILGLMTAPISIMTGGPGTGKTTCLLAAMDAMEARGELIKCAAPTGKAAKRMTEVCGREATTIHRLLGWKPDGWEHTSTNPLEANVVVIDEASMVDIQLAASLLDAIGNARLIIVGDSDQLPPVGPGQPLFDLLESATIPTFRLMTVHRQAGDSWVCDNAYKIIEGEKPDLRETPDFEFGQFEESEAIVQVAIHLSKKFPDIQILTPEHKKGAGTVNLNLAIQAALNPHDELDDHISANNYRIFEGDKVLYTKNNKDNGLVNGDIGYVRQVNVRGVDTLAYVEFDGLYDENHPFGWFLLKGRADLEPLTLAYAMTVHKCVTSDTLVGLQRHGVVTMEELVHENYTDKIQTTKGFLPFENAFLSAEKRPCIKITTKDGYELTVTPDHKMKVWGGYGYTLRKTEDLKIGQFLRLALHWDSGQVQELPPLPAGDIRSKRHRVPRYLLSEAAEFFGLMVADGTLYAKGFRLAKRHKDVVDRFCKLCSKLFHKKPKRWFENGAYFAEVNSVRLADWLRLIGGMNPNKKEIPQAILKSAKMEQADFLRGLFEDGTVNADEKWRTLDHIEWSTKYEKITHQVQILLLRFGIISSRTCRDGQWIIYIYGKNAQRFFNPYQNTRIGFINKTKNRRLQYTAGREQNYLIPVDPSSFHCDTYTGQNARQRGYISRATAEELGNFQEQLKFHHDRIVKLETTYDYVGCVTVPEHGRFLQNGFDGGNSQGSEWPFVLIIADKVHWSLRRQLLYTAVTRTHDRLAIVGSVEAIERAVKRPRDTNRRTLLRQRLTGGA